MARREGQVEQASDQRGSHLELNGRRQVEQEIRKLCGRGDTGVPTKVFRRDLLETNCAATPKSADVNTAEGRGTKLDFS